MLIFTFCNQNNLSVFNVLVCIQHCLQYVCPPTVEMQLGYVNAREYHFTGRRHSGLIRLAFEEVMALQVWNIIWRQVLSAAVVCKTLSIDHFPRDIPTRLRLSVLWYKCSESQSQSWSRKRTILSLSLNLVLELAHLWVSVSVWNFSSASCTLKSPLVLSPLYIILALFLSIHS